MSRNESLLKVSALFGIALGFAFGVYQTFVLDPTIPVPHEGVPDWMRVTHIHVLGLSIVVFLYATLVDDLFPNRGRTVSALAVLGQWGMPLTLYPVVALEIVVFGPIHNLLAVLMFGVGVAFAVAYVRS